MPDIATELGYYKRKPVIMVKPRVERTPIIGQPKRRFLVGIDQIYQWSEEHNATFEQHLMRIGFQIHALFDLGAPTTRKLAEIAFAIQSRIDDLLKMPPIPPEKKTVATVAVEANGQKFDHELKEEINGGYKRFSR
jgi:hypothetical protein